MVKGLLHDLARGKGLLQGKKLADLGLLAIRLAAGAVFVVHGWPKLINTTQTAAFFGNVGIPAPGFFAPFVGVVETLGGAMLILGAFASFFGIALVINMLIAIFMAKGLKSWGRIELDVMMLSAMVLMAVRGAGAYSVDAMRGLGLESSPAPEKLRATAPPAPPVA